MEMSKYFRGGYYSGGDLQFTPEKPGKDHFIVEDLFDFPNDDDTGLVGGDADGGFDAVTGNMTDSSIVTTGDRYSSSYSGHGPHFSGDFCEPYDELAELEWLSNFVEDCFSSQDHQKLHQISHIKSSSETESDISTITGRTTQSALFPPDTAVPAKARSKRSRGAPTKWSSRLPLLSLTPASSSDSGNKTPKPVAVSDGRKCLHCASDKTPQWRTGPMGPKTLCNACGVRYKSGRLVPEYRPAASPTFVVSKHSNSHRKVVELRRKKELQQQQLFWS